MAGLNAQTGRNLASMSEMLCHHGGVDGVDGGPGLLAVRLVVSPRCCLTVYATPRHRMVTV